MSKSRDNFLKYIIITLLVVAVLTLFSIEKEVKLQRTPAQIEEIAKQEKAEADAKAYRERQQKERDAKLISLPWAEVNSIEQGVMKAIAEGYLKFVVVLAILAAGPMIVRRMHRL